MSRHTVFRFCYEARDLNGTAHLQGDVIAANQVEAVNKIKQRAVDYGIRPEDVLIHLVRWEPYK